MACQRSRTSGGLPDRTTIATVPPLPPNPYTNHRRRTLSYGEEFIHHFPIRFFFWFFFGFFSSFSSMTVFVLLLVFWIVSSASHGFLPLPLPLVFRLWQRKKNGEVGDRSSPIRKHSRGHRRRRERKKRGTRGGRGWTGGVPRMSASASACASATALHGLSRRIQRIRRCPGRGRKRRGRGGVEPPRHSTCQHPPRGFGRA